MAGQVTFLRVLAIVFTGTLAVQAVAFLRQIVIASAFGIDRAMDLYVIVFGVAAVVGFGLGAVMENAALPMLVKRLEEGDRDGFGQIGLRTVIIGVAAGLVATGLFLVATPLVARFVTTGLTQSEQAAMMEIAWWFVPWVLIAAPYYAVASVLKAERRFQRFMAAEFVVTLVSLGVIYLWHPSVHAIALAYAAGYGCALLTMLPGLGLPVRLAQRGSGQSWGVARQIARFAAVTQMSTVSMLVDRFLASYLPAGAIAAGSYATLITGQASALLMFRDAFMVPLTAEQGRADKLERIVVGLLVLSIPAAAFLAVHAEAIVSVLLERGRFGPEAVTRAADMLRIQALSIPVGAVMLPMYRSLQIMGRMRFASYLLLAGAAVLMASGWVLIFVMELGVSGYLWSGLIASHVMIVLAWVQLRMAGLTLRLGRPAAFAAFAVAASAAALWVAMQWTPAASKVLVLAKDVLIFGVVFAACCLAIYPQLRRIATDIRTAAV